MHEIPVYRMITEAARALGGRTTYKGIIDYINGRYGTVSNRTIRVQIITLTVNHRSRGHYHPNKTARLTNAGSRYDVLFNIGRGMVELYNPMAHGVWEVFATSNGRFGIRRLEEPVQTIYTPQHIQWIKNITNSTNGQAYLGIEENSFILHFPTSQRGNVLSPQIDEIIILWQKIEGTACFTHLVTPVDNELIEDHTREDYRFGRWVRIIAVTPLEERIPVADTSWIEHSFSAISQGNACKLENVGSFQNLDDLRFELWEAFSDYFSIEDGISLATTRAIINELENNDTGLSATEGGLSLISHFAKERNSAIVRMKKSRALQGNVFYCEVCGFSFPAIFGADYIECHHLNPISLFGVRQTTLDDLALVCANCHRMLHAKFGGRFLTIEQLRNHVQMRMESLSAS